MQVWNLLHSAHWKHRTQKSRQKLPSGHHRTTLSDYIFTTKVCIDNQNNMSSTCPHNMMNFGLLAAEIGWPVWGTPPNFNGLRVLAALLHSSKVVSVSQTLRRWTEGANYVRQGDHHVGHWPTFLVLLGDIRLACRFVSHVSSLLSYVLQLKLENSLFHHVVHAVDYLSFVGVVALPFFQTPLLLCYAIVFFVIILASNSKLLDKYSVQTFIWISSYLLLHIW